MFKNELSLVPNKPGSYQMYNKDNIIIYVGKAKNLQKRLSSYFNRKHSGKTSIMVSEIDHFKYIVTSSELEAFLLEINLIKEYDPKYNILLKDDKSYPYIELILDPYPKLKVSRYLNIKKRRKKELYGPYPNAIAARKIVNLINRLYPLKKCDGVKKELCLYYHIHECLGYCSLNISPTIINNIVSEIREFLKGNEKFIKSKLLTEIDKYSKSMNYEKALELKNELSYMNIVLSKQKMELNDYKNRDIISYYCEKDYVSVQIFFIRNGKLIGSYDDIFTVTDLSSEIEYFIAKFYIKNEIPKEILLSDDINTELLKKSLNTNIVIPLKGKKHQLVLLAKNNAKLSLKNYFELQIKDEARTSIANNELKELLEMDSLYRIESFDNSHLFGTYYVSGMVVFKNGIPQKKDYRKYKIETNVSNDYDAMKEVIYRRFYRALMENSNLPDLILVDGGIIQINACKEVLNSLNLKIKVVGLVKNESHRTKEIIDGDNLRVFNIDHTSNLFHFLENIQNEVHRYTINYHRIIRSKGSISSVLNNINGIGNIRKKDLIKEFKNINNIKKASIDELVKIVPENIAKNIKEYFNNI